MLVYIRDIDKDKVVCPVDEKDIAEHLQVLILSRSLKLGHILITSQSFLPRPMNER